MHDQMDPCPEGRLAGAGQPGRFLLSDRPLDDVAADELGYADFAHALADALVTMAPQAGLVVAINGPWGSGKSTVLGFLRGAVESVGPDSVVLDFNPWVFANQDDLLGALLPALAEAVGARWQRKVVARLRLLLGHLVRLTGALSERDGLRAMADMVDGKPCGIGQLKLEVDKVLLENGKRIFVFADDIDRLSATQIKALFQTIKAVGDFQNVVYVLAYDHDVVAAALDDGPIRGSAYLEKIVQVPRSLPVPDPGTLGQMLVHQLNQILDAVDGPNVSQGRWATIMRRGVVPMLRTPRQVSRIANAVALTTAGLGSELNHADVVALETLHVGVSDVYETIRTGRDWFVSSPQSMLLAKSQEEAAKAFHSSWLERVPADLQEPVRIMVTALFPRVSGNVDRRGVIEVESVSDRRSARICAEEYFDLYFRLSLPAGAVTQAELAGLIASTGSADDLARTLKNAGHLPSGEATKRTRRYLHHLEDCAPSTIPEPHVAPVVVALMRVGDELRVRVPEASDMLDFGVGMLLDRIVSILLGRVDRPSRAAALRAAIEQTTAVTTIADIVTSFTADQADYPYSQVKPEPDRELDPADAAAITALAARKIHEAACDGSLVAHPDLLAVLFRWRDWAGPGEVAGWLAEMLHDDVTLVRFCEALLTESVATAGDDLTRTPTLQTDQLAEICDVSALATRCRALDRTQLTSVQVLAVTTFLDEVEGLSDGGPDELRRRRRRAAAG